MPGEVSSMHGDFEEEELIDGHALLGLLVW